MISFDAAYAVLFLVLASAGLSLSGALARVVRSWRRS